VHTIGHSSGSSPAPQVQAASALTRTWVHTPPRPYRRCTLVTLLAFASLWRAAPWLHAKAPGLWVALVAVGFAGLALAARRLLGSSPALPREVSR
jgi:hypothetical protein